MTTLNSPELFEKIAQDYEKRLIDASNQFQGAVMAATTEMQQMIHKWNKTLTSLASKPSTGKPRNKPSTTR